MSSGESFIQTQYSGERSAIRWANPSDPQDLERLRIIDQDAERIEWFESVPEDYKYMGDSALAKFATDTSKQLLYAVSGAPEVPGLLTSEVGELQGWIWVKRDDQTRIDQMVEQGIVPAEKASSSNIFEICYARLNSAPSLQIASGLRQACAELARIDSAINPDADEPRLVLACYIIPGNDKSIRVMDAAGFESSGHIQYDEEASEPDILYTINWTKLNTILKTKTRIPTPAN